MRTGSTCRANFDRRENICECFLGCLTRIGDGGTEKKRCPANDCQTEPPSCYDMMGDKRGTRLREPATSATEGEEILIQSEQRTLANP
jgi:hypothetical protein